MTDDMFKTLASYRIIDHLYDDRKDFIILGLCGRVGSGVSTISRILEMSLDEMQLPIPGYDTEDPLESREYRIVHTYASKNWNTFYKIRTSALITRHILNDSVDSFCKYINTISDCDKENIKKHAISFFTAEMECDLEQYYKYHSPSKQGDFYSPWKLLERDCPVEELESDAQKNEAINAEELKICELRFNGDYSDSESGDCAAFEQENIKEEEKETIQFSYDPKTKKCSFQNRALSKLLEKYAECHRKKSGFKNPFWFIVLKQYLYDFLPKVASELWKEMQKESQSLPTLALQCLGNNLRMNKQPYYDKSKGRITISKDGYECLAEEINLAIKVLRAYQLVVRGRDTDDDVRTYVKNICDPQNPYKSKHPQDIRTAIVIDSIKNPYESLYLKARYSNYYLIGVYTEDDERYKRLQEREHFVRDDIKAIDIIENNTKLKKAIESHQTYLKHKAEASAAAKERPECTTPEIIQKLYKQFEECGLLENLQYISPFILQNVSSCLESADILINNMRDNNSYTYLKKTMLRYVSLIMNPGLVLPTPVERCMQFAYTAKLNSGCLSRQVGAVVTDTTYHLLSVGWNQQPENQVPCIYRNLCEVYHHWDDTAYSQYESDDDDRFQKGIAEQVRCFWDTENSPLVSKGKLPSYCFKDYQNGINGERNQVHTRALHAEETAFLNLGANGERAANGVLFTTSSPCELCAKKAKYMGISKIYYVETYAGVSQKHVLNIGKYWPELILFTGAIGTAYTKLFTPLLPRKDENEMWLGIRMDEKLYGNVKKIKSNHEKAGDFDERNTQDTAE